MAAGEEEEESNLINGWKVDSRQSVLRGEAKGLLTSP